MPSGIYDHKKLTEEQKLSRRKYNISKEKLEGYLKTYTLQKIADTEGVSIDTIMDRCKEYELKPLGASYFNKGANNPAKRAEVAEKISKTVKGLWDNGVYADRINGMLYKCDWEHPNFTPKRSYREYAKIYHNPLTCYYCGCGEDERKIDIHHLDENRENWLLSNLLPVCNVCHTFFHFKRYKGPFITVGKIFRFESAHHLLNYCGPCEVNHGHSYILEVRIKGPINRDTGMTIDYKNLKSVVQKYVVDDFDHNTINEVMDCNPTAENMLLFIWEKLEKEGLVKGLQEIILKETESSTATIYKEDMMRYYTRNKELICVDRRASTKFPIDAKKTECKICGKMFWMLGRHLVATHNTTSGEYLKTYPNSHLQDVSVTKWKIERSMRNVDGYEYIPKEVAK